MRQAIVKKLYPFIAVIAFIIMVMFSFSFIHTPKSQAINPVIGDISFVKKFGYQPTAVTNDNLRIQAHLAYVENLLRQKDVSSLPSKLQQRRTHLLDLLHDYWTRGVFPRNYDYKAERKPCFIDKDGTICAVGYLVEQTAGREVAEAVNLKHKYHLVMEMNDEVVDDWINNSGLTKEECAMIQPSYSPCGRCSGNKVCVCRSNNCVYECECINPNRAAQWRAKGQPCNAKVNNKNSRVTNEDGAASKIIYPNLVSHSAIIPFSLSKTENVSIKIYDANGNLTTTLAEGKLENGDYEMEWNIGKVNNGIYFLRMQTAESALTKKLILIK